jgi:mono/diheme cytochrome c family protein
MRQLVIVILFLPLFLTAGAFYWVSKSQDQGPTSLPTLGKPPETDDPTLQAGWKVYTSKGCVFCHGPAGEGGVKNPNAVGGLIPPLKAVAEGYNEEELKEKILKGVPVIDQEKPDGPPPPLYMPAWEGLLTEQELNQVVAYLMSLAPKTESWDE